MSDLSLVSPQAEVVVNGKNGTHSHPAADESFQVAPPSTIVKRDGRVVPFDITLIEKALEKCFASFNHTPQTSLSDLARQVVNVVAAKATQPTVEEVQDIVETVLQAAGEYEAAKRYILYRAEHAKIRSQRPVPARVREAFDQSDKYFPTQLQKFQFYDKYSRFNYELGRRETWIETVDRAVDYLRELSEARLPAESYQRIRQGILEMRSLPSMRLLAMAGPAARRNQIAIYNCSYMPVESVDSFVEALIISMSGCGVGFSVERRYVENFPRIRRQTGMMAPRHVIEDSSEGWADALRVGLATWFDGGDLPFDYSLVRPAGAPLRTKGGRASGPEPLRKMLEFARNRILARQGGFLRPLDAHDMMCMVGEAAVSGGVRRTAMLSLFDYDDMEMRLCKSGDFSHNNSQRWNANNSAVWPEYRLGQAEIAHSFLDMVDSGRGEPGIFNRRAAIEYGPTRRQAADFGTNPCVVGDTWIAVADGRGRAKMRDLVAEGKDVAVYTLKDGDLVVRTMRNPRKTGTNVPVYRVRFADGTDIRATANHKFQLTTGEWVEVGCLQANAALVSLTMLNRGHASESKPTLADYDSPRTERMLVFDNQERAEQRFLYEQHTDAALPRSQAPHRALDIKAQGKSSELPIHYKGSIAFATKACEACGAVFEIEFSRREIATCSPACANKLYQQHDGAKSLAQDGHTQGDRHQQTTVYNDLVVSLGRHPMKEEWAAACKLQGISPEISRVGGPFCHWHDLQDAAAVANHRVISVALDGYEDVYNGTVDDTHTYFSIGSGRQRDGRSEMSYVLSRNCGEINLRPQSFCNLSIAIARPDDTFESLKEKVELATIIGTIQSMATHFPGLRPQWKQNCEEERLLGVDITGQMDSPAAQDAALQERLRHLAVETNRQVAAALGINQSAAVTCVKPSGNSSQLLNCSPGIHTRWAPYYIRNVRVAAHSPVFKVLRDTGVPMDPENGQTPENATTWVIHFPVKSPDGAVTRNDRTAIEQCNYWLQNKLHWTEHNPSVTITYRPDEVLDLIKWVWEHQDKIGGMAFLPASDAQYDQMPYMEIDEEEYHRLVAKFPEIDFSKIYRYEEEDLTTAAQEFACLAGSCDI